MALEFAHGAIQWRSTDALGTTYQVSGLGFQPKAIRFYWMGIGSTVNAGSDSTHIRAGVGFAVSATDRRCVGVVDADAAADATCGAVVRNDAIAATLTAATPPVQDGALDLTNIAPDGFTLTVDDAAPVDITVFWEAWGGTSITVASIVDIVEPGAIGNVDYTVTGFTAGGTDQVVMFAGCESTAAINTVAETAAGLMMGCASSGTAADNIVVETNQPDGAASSSTATYSKSGECLAMGAVAGGTAIDARAQLTQFNLDGFRLNWLARASTRRFFALAIKGGSWDAGPFTMDGTVVGNTTTISGLSFRPVGLSFCDGGNAENTGTTGSALGRLSAGTADSTTSRRSMAMQSRDAVATTETSLRISYDSVLVKPGDTGLVNNDFDLDAILNDGFRIITRTNTTGTGATDWKGYLAFGSLGPLVTVHPVPARVVPGETATFTVTATGTGTLTYQWQKDDGAGGALTNISGATSSSYTTPTLALADNNYRYRCVVTDSNGDRPSNVARLGVDANGSVVTSGKALFDATMILKGWW